MEQAVCHRRWSAAQCGSPADSAVPTAWRVGGAPTPARWMMA